MGVGVYRRGLLLEFNGKYIAYYCTKREKMLMINGK